MLKTADYECHDREEDRPDLTYDIRSCRCHQDRNTYQNIAQDAGGDSLQRRNAYLADCHFDGIGTQKPTGVIQITGKINQGINDQRTDQIAEVNHDQIADTFEPGHLFAYHIHDDQAVTGKKFSAHKYNDHQSHREDDACHESCQTYIVNGMCCGTAGSSAQCDERTCHNA